MEKVQKKFVRTVSGLNGVTHSNNKLCEYLKIRLVYFDIVETFQTAVDAGKSHT